LSGLGLGRVKTAWWTGRNVGEMAIGDRFQFGGSFDLALLLKCVTRPSITEGGG